MKLPWRKEDWKHYVFRRNRWPEGITTWTYSRMAHPFMWLIFGNDRDGCTPWVHGKQWSWFWWWLRNRAANMDWVTIGLSSWEEGVVGDAAWPTSTTLESKYWIGKDPESPYIISWVRDSLKGRTIWRPYIRILLLFGLSFWCGWKPSNGKCCMALKRKYPIY